MPAMGYLSLSNSHKAIAIALSFAFLAIPLGGKGPILTAIELYNGPNGPSYVQITDVLFNGKVELRVCGTKPKIGKSEYEELAKIIPNAGTTIEYGNDGILTLKKDAATVCVVPSNLKIEKSASLTPSDFAARVLLGGRVLANAHETAGAPPPLVRGVKLVFVAAPNLELAEYLRAERAATISVWQGYLAQYPSTAHATVAKESLAALLVEDGENSLEGYQKQTPGATRTYSGLKTAKLRADEAIANKPDNAPAAELKANIQIEQKKLVNEGRNEIHLYKQGMRTGTAGYAHLTTALALASACTEIDPGYAEGQSFQTQANKEASEFEANLSTAEALMSAKKYDESFSTISDYKSFAGEVPRLAAIVNTEYQFHFDRGQEAATGNGWEVAIVEFQNALETKATKEAATELSNAKESLNAERNAKAAEDARERSRILVEKQKLVEAYEVFNDLPEAQKALVKDDMDRLSPMFIENALDEANEIETAHDPIHGVGDEREMQRAYKYLEDAYTLSQKPELKDRRNNLGDKLSNYYLNESKRLMNKPLGTGALLGWAYLQKAREYKASNVNEVRDELTLGTEAFQMRSKLSIRVLFRDQTTRREGPGFPDQLADAIATGLEGSGLPVKVFRALDAPAFEPNFKLVGDVMEHQIGTISTSLPKESRYRVAERDIPNPDWNKANREYESTKEELETAREAVRDINLSNNKKGLKAAAAKEQAAQQKLDDARAKLDEIPKSIPEDVTRPYNYSVKTLDTSLSVKLKYRIEDLSGNLVMPAAPVEKLDEKKFESIENVRPEDVDGIKESITGPNETQMLTKLENGTRDELIKAAIESVAKLPDIVFQRAQKQIDGGDFESAAESYILYLNSTAPGATPKRQQAEQFLYDNFNIPPVSSPSL